MTKGKPHPSAGTGRVSQVWRPTHTHKACGKWFDTEEHAQAYREQQNLYKKVRAAGYDAKDPAQVAEFVKIRAEVDEANGAIIERRRIEAEAREEFRKEHGIAKNQGLAMAIRSAQIKDAKAREKLKGFSRELLTDEQRIERIRKIYNDKTNTPVDVLLKTAQVIGVHIGKESFHGPGKGSAQTNRGLGKGQGQR